MSQNMDYINMDVEGTCVSVPSQRGRTFTFEMENRRGESISKFHVIVRNEVSFAIKEGDKVFITKAGFFARNGINNLAVIEGSSINVITSQNEMDYISIDVVGTCISIPTRQGRKYTFEMENRRGESISKFYTIVRDDSPIDINEGDRIVITKAGFFTKNGVNILAVIEGSNIEVLRIRCNLGDEFV